MNIEAGNRGTARTVPRALAPSLERRRVRFYLGMMIVDVALIFAAFFMAGRVYLAPQHAGAGLLQAQLLMPLYVTLALYQGAFSIRALDKWRYAAGRALFALALAAALLIFLTFYAKFTTYFSRVVFTLGLFGSAGLIAASRRLLGWWIARHWGSRVMNTLLIAAGGPAIVYDKAITVSAELDHISPDPGDPMARDRLGRYLLNMDRVIVSCPIEDRLEWAAALRAAGVRGEVVTDRLGELEPIGLSVEDGWRALIVSTGPLGVRQRVAKRIFDLALSAAALVVLFPLLALVALAIKLEDGGPVFFSQRRMGRGNRFFDVLKFRSMRVERGDTDGTLSASRDDGRIIRVGRLIRRTSVDELPQLLNVLRGEMSRYPLLYGYSDLLVVPAAAMDAFAHYCGIFAALNVFAEAAVPTALALAVDDIVTELEPGENFIPPFARVAGRKWRGLEFWTLEAIAEFEQANGNRIDRMLASFPEDRLYVHPVKLSRFS